MLHAGVSAMHAGCSCHCAGELHAQLNNISLQLCCFVKQSQNVPIAWAGPSAAILASPRGVEAVTRDCW